MMKTSIRSNKEYFFALMPFIKKGQWGVVKQSLQKRREALKISNSEASL